MTVLSSRLAVPNGLLLVADPDTTERPERLDGGSISATAWCVAVGTRHGCDGETEVRVSDSAQPLDGALQLRWQGALLTNATLAVMTVEGKVVIGVPSRMARRLQVWTDDPMSPTIVSWVVTSAGELAAAPSRDDLVAIVHRVRRAAYDTEHDEDVALARFDRAVPFPHAYSVIFHWERYFPAMPTDEEIVDRALAHRAIEL